MSMNPRPWTDERFLARLTHTDEPTSCWPWQGCTWLGYGHLRVNGKDWRAHRFAYTLFVGPIDAGADVLHTCDNPACCNPAHLFLGDQAANMQDREAKGRHNAPRGSLHGRAKLSEDDVRAIRQAAKDGIRQNVLARQYGVTETVLSLAVRRITWRHVE